MMSDKKSKAVALRKQGMVYSEIHASLGVPKSTLSVWLRCVELSPEAEKRIRSVGGANHWAAAKAHTVIWEQKRAVVRDSYVPPLNDPAFVLGLGLYWGEGSKHGTAVTMTNTDPDVLRVFKSWACRYFAGEFDGFCVRVNHYFLLPDADVLRYWSGVLNVPVSCFYKSGKTKHRIGSKGKLRENGVCTMTLRGSAVYRVRIKIDKAIAMLPSLFDK